MWEVYWEQYEISVMPDHVVFERYRHCLHKVVGYEIHGDDGRSLKQTGLEIMNWQATVGWQTAVEFWDAYDEDLVACFSQDEKRLYMKMLLLEVMQVNFKGLLISARVCGFECFRTSLL